MIATNVSVAICQLPIREFCLFGKLSNKNCTYPFDPTSVKIPTSRTPENISESPIVDFTPKHFQALMHCCSLKTPVESRCSFLQEKRREI